MQNNAASLVVSDFPDYQEIYFRSVLKVHVENTIYLHYQ